MYCSSSQVKTWLMSYRTTGLDTLDIATDIKVDMKATLQDNYILALLTVQLTLCSNTGLETFDIAADIRADIRAAQEDDDRRRVVDWLKKGVPDPSKEHNEARSKHEETTGAWLFDSDEFKQWIEGKNSFLWLNGNGQ